MGKHALLSASSSHRWLACPPSARLCENYEDTGSEYAQQGTDAHSLCEHKLKLALGMETKDPTAEISFYEEEMEECACGYAEYVLLLVEEAKKTCKDPVVLIEQKLDFSRFVKDGFGTGDCVIIADGTLYIIDYKHGKGVEVSATENPQMMLYALGALELFDGIPAGGICLQPDRKRGTAMVTNNNPNVTVIPARYHAARQEKDEDKPKLRVAAYCRVSTDSEEQATSYEAQIEHYTEYIQKNPEWELAGIFADEGLSGTDTRKRGEFNRMIEECMAGKINMVITKSISRFARNTLDCLKYIRQLKDRNIPVLFEKENINTMDSKGEVLLTIMASLAQQESQSLSQNVKLGLQYRYQQGLVQVNHNRFLGYTKDEEGRLVIEPEEAEVVKRIYREYLEGASLAQIGKSLEADGILTAAGKEKWRPETLKKILQNEKYIGDALLQKTYTVDFLSKKRVKNNGIVPQYYVENSHEPIIPRDLYMQVQEEMVRRVNLHSGAKRKKRVYSSKYALSSIVYCSKCGDIYRRIAWNNRGKHSTVWRCCTRVEHGPKKCDAPTIQESDLQDAVVKAIQEVLGGKDVFLTVLEKNIREVLESESGEQIEKIDCRLKELQQELLRLANGKKEYGGVADEIHKLREQRQDVLTQDAERDGRRQRIDEMRTFLMEQLSESLAYDEQLVRRLVEKITVYGDKMTVKFKSGLEIDLER
mgnify:CR=1 FL=1|jgi:DNA invertase Pin-like site-specific DNA recombinase